LVGGSSPSRPTISRSGLTMLEVKQIQVTLTYEEINYILVAEIYARNYARDCRGTQLENIRLIEAGNKSHMPLKHWKDKFKKFDDEYRVHYKRIRYLRKVLKGN
jgi:hypothetical protein